MKAKEISQLVKSSGHNREDLGLIPSNSISKSWGGGACSQSQSWETETGRPQGFSGQEVQPNWLALGPVRELVSKNKMKCD